MRVSPETTTSSTLRSAWTTKLQERDQVKGSSNPDGNKLYHGEADAVFHISNGELATRSVLVTNRPFGPGLQERCSQTLDTDEIEN